MASPFLGRKSEDTPGSWTSCPNGDIGPTRNQGQLPEGPLKRRETIVYWEFNIDILGPRFQALKDRRRARKVLSRKRLQEIERAALTATKAKLPAGFRAILS